MEESNKKVRNKVQMGDSNRKKGVKKMAQAAKKEGRRPQPRGGMQTKERFRSMDRGDLKRQECPIVRDATGRQRSDMHMKDPLWNSNHVIRM